MREHYLQVLGAFDVDVCVEVFGSVETGDFEAYETEVFNFGFVGFGAIDVSDVW